MPPNVDSQPAVCPVCRGTNFTRSSTGFPLAGPRFTCAICGTWLKPASGRPSVTYRIEKIGSQFSNLAGQLEDQLFDPQSGQAPVDPIYSDSDLLQFAQGSIAADFLTGDEDCEVPFTTGPEETIIFALENLYCWENRPRGGEAEAGLKNAQVKPGGWAKVPLLGEPKTYNLLETLDAGSLYLTNSRYLFLGKKRSVEDELNRVASVLPFQNGIGILRKDRQRIEFYKGTYYWPLVGSVLNGLALIKRREHAR